MSRLACVDATTGVILQEMQTESYLSDTAERLYISVGDSFSLLNKHYNISANQFVDGLLDTRTLPQVKADAWARIKAERTSRLASTFTHAGNTYDIDPNNLTGASIDAREALIAGEPWTQMWVLADNTVVTLNAPEMIAVGRACKAEVSNLWATSQYLRGLIEAATTSAAIEAITWP